jgi:hypothetical protein
MTNSISQKEKSAQAQTNKKFQRSTPAGTPAATIERQFIEVLLSDPAIALRTYKQRDKLEHFHLDGDPVAAVVYRAIGSIVHAKKKPGIEEIHGELESWLDDPSLPKPEITKEAFEWVSSIETFGTMSLNGNGFPVATELAKSIKARWDEQYPEIPRDEITREAKDIARNVAKAQAPAAAAPKPSRFKILTSDEIKERPSPKYLVDGIIVENSIVALISESGSYKSFVSFSLGASIANGLDWYGRSTQQRPALAALGEGSGGASKRIKAWEIRHGCPMSLHILPEAVQLLSAIEVAEFIESIEQLPEMPGLIIIDTLARSFVGGDENAARDMGMLVASVDQIRKATGATILIVHHVGKSGDIRGSTALTGAADTIIRARADGDLLTLECEKQKDDEPFERISLLRRVVELEDGETSLIFDLHENSHARPNSKANQVKEQMLDILRTEFPPEGARAKDWLEKCENAKLGKSRTFYNHVDEMTGDQIEKIGGLWKIKDCASTANTANTAIAVQMHKSAQHEEVLQKSTAFPPPVQGGMQYLQYAEVSEENAVDSSDSENGLEVVEI